MCAEHELVSELAQATPVTATFNFKTYKQLAAVVRVLQNAQTLIVSSCCCCADCWQRNEE